METGTAKIRWWRVLLGGFLIEVALMVVAVVIFVAVANPVPVLNIAVPPTTLLVAVPIAAWAARGMPQPVLAGILTGVAALALYALMTGAGYLASPGKFDSNQAFGPAYLASHVLKLAGGAIGGWWAARKRPVAA